MDREYIKGDLTHAIDWDVTHDRHDLFDVSDALFEERDFDQYELVV